MTARPFMHTHPDTYCDRLLQSVPRRTAARQLRGDSDLDTHLLRSRKCPPVTSAPELPTYIDWSVFVPYFADEGNLTEWLRNMPQGPLRAPNPEFASCPRLDPPFRLERELARTEAHPDFSTLSALPTPNHAVSVDLRVCHVHPSTLCLVAGLPTEGDS